jgi:ribosomal protein L37AE/L43A
MRAKDRYEIYGRIDKEINLIWGALPSGFDCPTCKHITLAKREYKKDIYYCYGCGKTFTDEIIEQRKVTEVLKNEHPNR